MVFVRLRNSPSPVAVGKIICVGRNYAEHAKEMRAEVPTFPVLFLKPSTAVIGDRGTVVIPDISNNLHHEVEMTILIGKGGSGIPRERAPEYVAGYGIGLDMTLRDVQDEAKKKGLPWALAKGFDTSAPLSEFVPASAVQDPHQIEVRLTVNNELRQLGNTKDCIFLVDDLISTISRYFSLEPGDIIMTGTPQGVNRVVPGDRLTAELRTADGMVLTSLSVGIR
ncbi:MAG: fumarylacetoacetate hydrolase family protein [Ignavibacteria bacterium]|nr:fumarylacetoacetate hydrolase family protein [Ignavibacteria bacterium]